MDCSEDSICTGTVVWSVSNYLAVDFYYELSQNYESFLSDMTLAETSHFLGNQVYPVPTRNEYFNIPWKGVESDQSFIKEEADKADEAISNFFEFLHESPEKFPEEDTIVNKLGQKLNKEDATCEQEDSFNEIDLDVICGDLTTCVPFLLDEPPLIDRLPDVLIRRPSFMGLKQKGNTLEHEDIFNKNVKDNFCHLDFSLLGPCDVFQKLNELSKSHKIEEKYKEMSLPELPFLDVKFSERLLDDLLNDKPTECEFNVEVCKSQKGNHHSELSSFQPDKNEASEMHKTEQLCIDISAQNCCSSLFANKSQQSSEESLLLIEKEIIESFSAISDIESGIRKETPLPEKNSNTNTFYRGDDLERANIFELALAEGNAETVADLKVPGDTNNDLKESGDVNVNLEDCGVINADLKEIAHTDDDLKENAHTDDDLKENAHTDDDLKENAHTDDDLNNSEHTNDDLNNSEHTNDDLNSKHTNDDLNSEHTNDDFTYSRHTNDDFNYSRHTKDDLKNSVHTNNNLKDREDTNHVLAECRNLNDSFNKGEGQTDLNINQDADAYLNIKGETNVDLNIKGDADLNVNEEADACLNLKKRTNAYLDTNKDTDASLDMNEDTDAYLDINENEDASLDKNEDPDASLDMNEDPVVYMDMDEDIDGYLDINEGPDASSDISKDGDASSDISKDGDAYTNINENTNAYLKENCNKTTDLKTDKFLNLNLKSVLSDSKTLYSENCLGNDKFADVYKEKTVTYSETYLERKNYSTIAQAKEIKCFRYQIEGIRFTQNDLESKFLIPDEGKIISSETDLTENIMHHQTELGEIKYSDEHQTVNKIKYPISNHETYFKEIKRLRFNESKEIQHTQADLKGIECFESHVLKKISFREPNKKGEVTYSHDGFDKMVHAFPNDPKEKPFSITSDKVKIPDSSITQYCKSDFKVSQYFNLDTQKQITSGKPVVLKQLICPLPDEAKKEDNLKNVSETIDEINYLETNSEELNYSVHVASEERKEKGNISDFKEIKCSEIEMVNEIKSSQPGIVKNIRPDRAASNNVKFCGIDEIKGNKYFSSSAIKETTPVLNSTEKDSLSELHLKNEKFLEKLSNLNCRSLPLFSASELIPENPVLPKSFVTVSKMPMKPYYPKKKESISVDAKLPFKTGNRDTSIDIDDPLSFLSIRYNAPDQKLDKENRNKNHTPDMENTRIFMSVATKENTKTVFQNNNVTKEKASTTYADGSGIAVQDTLLIQISGNYLKAVETTENFAVPLLKKLMSSEKFTFSLQHTIARISSDTTRFLLNQEMKRCHDANIDPKKGGTEESFYCQLLALHGLLKTLEFFLQCDLSFSITCLKEYEASHSLLLHGYYQQLIEKLNKIHFEMFQSHTMHPKIEKLCSFLLQKFSQCQDNDAEIKVLIIVKRYLHVFYPIFKSAFNSFLMDNEVHMIPESLHLKKSPEILRDKTNCIFVANSSSLSEDIAWSQFSLVIDYEYNNNSTWKSSCIRFNVAYASIQICNLKCKTFRDIKNLSLPCEENPVPDDNYQAKSKSVLLIGSDAVVSNEELLRCLESKENITMIERNYKSLIPHHFFPDIDVDERTAIVIVAVPLLKQEEYATILMNQVFHMHIKYETCWAILCKTYKSSSERNDTFQENLWLFCLFCSQISSQISSYNVKILFADNNCEISSCVRNIADYHHRNVHNDDSDSNSFLKHEITHDEIFLLSFPCLNPFTVHVMLSTVKFEDLLQMDYEDMASKFSFIPKTFLKMFHSMMHTALNSNLSQSEIKESTKENGEKFICDNMYEKQENSCPENEISFTKPNALYKSSSCEYFDVETQDENNICLNKEDSLSSSSEVLCVEDALPCEPAFSNIDFKNKDPATTTELSLEDIDRSYMSLNFRCTPFNGKLISEEHDDSYDGSKKCSPDIKNQSSFSNDFLFPEKKNLFDTMSQESFRNTPVKNSFIKNENDIFTPWDRKKDKKYKIRKTLPDYFSYTDRFKPSSNYSSAIKPTFQGKKATKYFANLKYDNSSMKIGHLKIGTGQEYLLPSSQRALANKRQNQNFFAASTSRDTGEPKCKAFIPNNNTSLSAQTYSNSQMFDLQTFREVANSEPKVFEQQNSQYSCHKASPFFMWEKHALSEKDRCSEDLKQLKSRYLPLPQNIGIVQPTQNTDSPPMDLYSQSSDQECSPNRGKISGNKYDSASRYGCKDFSKFKKQKLSHENEIHQQFL